MFVVLSISELGNASEQKEQGSFTPLFLNHLDGRVTCFFEFLFVQEFGSEAGVEIGPVRNLEIIACASIVLQHASVEPSGSVPILGIVAVCSRA